MKTMFRVATVAAILALGQATLRAVEDIPWPSVTDQVKAPRKQPNRQLSQASPFVEEDSSSSKPEADKAYYNDSCNDDSCSRSSSCCEGLVPACERCPRLGVVGLFGFDSFHGFSDGDYPSKFGALTGLNAGGPVPGLQALGIGWQIGSTFGVYDWDGRSALDHEAHSMDQTFITMGFFRKPSEGRFSCGVVYDWMIAENWGTFGVSPTLGQWRGQAEYAFSDCNSVGVWGTIHERNHSQDVAQFATVQVVGRSIDIPLPLSATIQDSAVDQIDIFWHHKFCCGADSLLWCGIPEHTKLPNLFDRRDSRGSLGEFILGANLQVPLSQQVAVYGNMQYMRPTAAAGDGASREQTYDIGVGIMWYPGRNARTATVNGSCAAPYMPVANNATFLVDQNMTR